MGKVLQRTVAELFVLLQVTHRGDHGPTVRVEGPSSPRGHGAPACEVMCARAQVDVEGVDSRSAKLEARHFQEDLVRAVPMPEP
jgi:hypothetical protein